MQGYGLGFGLGFGLEYGLGFGFGLGFGLGSCSDMNESNGGQGDVRSSNPKLTSFISVLQSLQEDLVHCKPPIHECMHYYYLRRIYSFMSNIRRILIHSSIFVRENCYIL